MATVKKVAVNTGILYARMAITVFISLYSTRLTLEALGVGDFGIFNVVGGVIAMLGFLNSAMAAASQRYMSFAQGEGDFPRIKKIFNVSIALHFFLSILIVLALEVAGVFFFKNVLNIAAGRIDAAMLVYQFMIVSTVFTVISVPYDAIINARENMFVFAVLGVVEAVLKLGIAFYLKVNLRDNLIVYGFLTALLAILILLLKAVFCSIKYEEARLAIRKQFDKKLMREMMSFAGWTLLYASTTMLSFYGQGIVMNVFFGTVINAAQGVATQVGGQLSTFAGTMLRALNPTIAKSEGAGDRQMMLKTTMAGSKFAFFLLTIMFIPFLIEAPFILKIWLKDVPDYTVIFCRLLLTRNLIEQLFVTLYSSIAAVGAIRKFQISSAILAVFPLIVSYFLYKIGFPPYTIYVVFIIYSLASSTNILYFAKKLCGLSIKAFFNEVIVRCFAIFAFGITISSVPLLIMDAGFLRLSLVVVLSLMSFFILVWTLGLNGGEKSYLTSASGKFLRNIPFLKERFLKGIN